MDQVAPWGLTPGEARALDAICNHESSKTAARALGLSHRTIENQLARAYYKMGVRRFREATRVHAMRLWLAHHGAIRLDGPVN